METEKKKKKFGTVTINRSGTQKKLAKINFLSDIFNSYQNIRVVYISSANTFVNVVQRTHTSIHFHKHRRYPFSNYLFYIPNTYFHLCLM